MGGVTIALIVIGALLLSLVITLAASPLSIRIIYDGELTCLVQYLFVKYRIYPFDEKLKALLKGDKEKPEKKEAKPKKSEKSKAKKKGSFEEMQEIIDFITEAVSSGSSLLKLVLSLQNMVVETDIKVAASDAAQTAIKCGKINAYLHSAISVAANFTRVKNTNLKIYPDYKADKNEAKFTVKISSAPAKYIFNLHKFVPPIMSIVEALPMKLIKGEKKK